VDPGRGNYSDDQSGRWYDQERDYGERHRDGRHGGAEDAGRYGDPELRDAFGGFEPPARSFGSRSGVELPPAGGGPGYSADPPLYSESGDPGTRVADPSGFHTEPLDRAALRRPPSSLSSAPDTSGSLGTGGAFFGPGGTALTGFPGDGSPNPGVGGALDSAGAVGGPTMRAMPGVGDAPGGGPGGVFGGGSRDAGAGRGPASGGRGRGGGVTAGAGDPAAGAVYTPKKAGVGLILFIVAGVCELLLVRVLLTGEFGSKVAPGAVLSGLFAMTGVPLAALGLYALMTGAAAAAGPNPGRAWLRTPLAYLPVGLVLIVAAALAAR
jgi:hypothetical protein